MTAIRARARLLTAAVACAACVALVNAQGSAQQSELYGKTRDRLAAIAGDLDGVMGYVVIDLESAERFERLADKTFPLASTIKLAILYELFKQADEGRLRLDEQRPVDPRHAVGGSGVLTHLDSPSMSLRDYAVLMVVLSDNTATNLLIDMVGMDAVTRRMNGLGMSTLKLQRRMMDAEAARKGRENVGTPSDLARLLAMIYRGEGLSKTGAEGIIAILEKPKTSALRDGVPSSVRVANKTGTLPGVVADAGVVYVTGRPYIFVATTAFLQNDAAGHAAIRTASRAAFEYFHRIATSSEYGRVIR